MKWSIGITACPRSSETLALVIDSLKASGWDSLTVYAEPQTKVGADVRIVRRDKVYGCWTNWICALYDMYSMDIEAEVYAIFEDDISLCRNIRPYLENLIPSLARFGALSLYTPSHQSKRSLGLHCIHDEAFRAERVWGTQAIVFSKDSLVRFLTAQNVMDHRRVGYGIYNKNRDTALGIWAKVNGERLFCHTPSLVQHIGKESSVHHEFHSAVDFVGEDFDAMTLLNEKIPIVISPNEIHFI